ncbi:MAG: GTP cyclohydrolase I FolE2 [Deltaproteobacteria bacterium]|nr:GTP cyclohydrolase I FolE2 [Deltaproteobacteria bacterium]
MDDVQNHLDVRGIALDQVGVSDLRCPIVVLDRKRERQSTIANVSMSVELPHEFKGTHMSRFIEVLEAHRGEITMRTLPDLLRNLKDRLDAPCARIELRFPYFVERVAPVSAARALMDYECWFIGESKATEEDFVLGVRVPVTSLCPCSKAISDYGAHNQRGYITMEVRGRKDEHGKPNLIWIEELIELAELSGSAPVYPLLKRADERHVTMQAFDNPVFVEDMVRNVAARLRDDSRVASCAIHAVNHESIHNHSAFAKTVWVRQ